MSHLKYRSLAFERQLMLWLAVKYDKYANKYKRFSNVTNVIIYSQWEIVLVQF